MADSTDRNYTDTGDRGNDPRVGFGDDMGTRVGRPDGAREAHEAPHDANPGQQPGDPSTNDGAVPDGIEGSIIDGDGDGQQAVQDATHPDRNVNPDREGGKDRVNYDV